MKITFFPLFCGIAGNLARLEKLEEAAHDVLDTWFGSVQGINVEIYKGRYTKSVDKLRLAYESCVGEEEGSGGGSGEGSGESEDTGKKIKISDDDPCKAVGQVTKGFEKWVENNMDGCESRKVTGFLKRLPRLEKRLLQALDCFDESTACDISIHKDVDLVQTIDGFNPQDFEISWFFHDIFDDYGPDYEHDIYSMSGETSNGEAVPFGFETVWKKYKLECNEEDVKKGKVKKEAKCKVSCRNGWSLKNKRDKPTDGIGMRIKCKGNEWSYMKKGNKERLGLKDTCYPPSYFEFISGQWIDILNCKKSGCDSYNHYG